MPSQCGDDNRRIFAGHLYECGKTRMAFHQGHDMAVLGAAQEIALPMTRYGAVLNFSGPLPDGDGICDLTARVSKDTRVLRAAYATLGSQVPQQLLLQHSGNLLRRPVQNQFTRNDLLQLHMDRKKALLGPQSRLPGFRIRLVGSIHRTATMTCDFPAHGRHRSVQAFGDLTYRRARSNPPRDLLALTHREREA